MLVTSYSIILGKEILRVLSNSHNTCYNLAWILINLNNLKLENILQGLVLFRASSTNANRGNIVFAIKLLF